MNILHKFKYLQEKSTCLEIALYLKNTEDFFVGLYMQRMKTLFFKNKKKSKDEEKYQESQEELNEIEDICVIGAGLVGLSAIASLIKEVREQNNTNKQYRIRLIEKRNFNFERSQKLIVNPNELVPGLEKGLTWKEFALQLFNPKNVYAVDDKGDLFRRDGQKISLLNKREKFIRKMLRNRPEIKAYETFSIKSLQYALLEYIDDPINKPANLQIEKYPEATITEIKKPLKHGKMSLNIHDKTGTNKLISFNTLLLCEGERREMTELLNKKMLQDKQKPFQFKPFVNKKTFNCIVRLKFKSLDQIEEGKFKNYDELLKEAKLDININEYKEKLAKLGWTLDHLPSKSLNTNFDPRIETKRPIFGFSCELPEKIFKMPERTPSERESKNQKIIQWAITLACESYNVPPEYLEFDKKGGDATEKLRITTFSPNLKYVDRPWREMNGANIILMGDCAMSSHYKTGVGARMGMNIASNAAKCIVSTSENSPESFNPLQRQYNLFINQQAENISQTSSESLCTQYSQVVSTSKLINAVNSGNDGQVKSLLAQGESPNILCKSTTPLSAAIRAGHLEIAEVLLKYGANPNLLPSALAVAIEKQDFEAMNLLFSYGVNPNVPPGEVDKLINLALETKNLEMITQLLIGGVKVRDFYNYVPYDSPLREDIMEIEKVIETNSELLPITLDYSPTFYILNRVEVINQLTKTVLDNDSYLKPYCSNTEIEKIKESINELLERKQIISQLDDLNNIAYINKIDDDGLKKCFEKAYGKILNSPIDQTIFQELVTDLKANQTLNSFSSETNQKLIDSFIKNVENYIEKNIKKPHKESPQNTMQLR